MTPELLEDTKRNANSITNFDSLRAEHSARVKNESGGNPN